MKKNESLVSAIITTKNEEKNIETCLKSIASQTYKNVEIIVVDNGSTDNTKKIARKYTALVFDKGPERSVQRNFGVRKAKGEYVLMLDADMKLTEKVVEECIKEIQKEKVGGIIIPEESFGKGFWAQCKRLERSFYAGNDYIEAARFFQKKAFKDVGGFDEEMISGEDWDLSHRICQQYALGRTKSVIYHNEGRLSLKKTVKKKYYYSKKIGIYLKKNENTTNSQQQFSILSRYKIFFSNPVLLFENPILGIGMLFMKTCEFIAGGIGYVYSLKLRAR